MSVGKSEIRKDAFDKATGRAKYTEDLCGRNALIAKVLHSTIAHGIVKRIDTEAAEKIPGVIKIVTCFEVPQNRYPTAGHPWAMEPERQDVMDRLMLNRHVRYYGDDVAAVVAENEVIVARALNAITVEYEQMPFVLDPSAAMKENASVLHPEEGFKNNILAHTGYENGDYAAAIQDPELVKVEGWYDTPMVHHCHLENHICFSWQESGKQVIVTSTQIPHITRRVIGQALSIPWGDVRVIKPYVGGGFGNKQDVHYEPLCAYLSRLLGGRLVLLETSREEGFVSNRVRHAIKYHMVTYARRDGTFVARKVEAYSNQGAYASHGHAIVHKGILAFGQLYKSLACQADAYTVYTNAPVAGAMRGYGIPQEAFALECHIEDIAKNLGIDTITLHKKNMMEVGYAEPNGVKENYFDSLNQCIEKGKESIHWDEKIAAYQNQTGNIRRGIGMSIFWYLSNVWPIALESSSCRMVLNQDGSIQIQMGETEIGQGADTAFCQMAADTLGIPFSAVHIISMQDTDITPYGSGAYASRQTYVGGFAVRKTATYLKERILKHASQLTHVTAFNLDIVDGNIVRITDGRAFMSLGELASRVLYSMENSEHLTAECTHQCKSNAYSFGCCFAEIEVDIALCKIKLLNMVNVHDAGRLINPALAEAQVHGGMSMAIGYGLSEQVLMDPATGRVLNNNLLDYKVGTAMDHPNLKAEFVQNYEPTSAYGAKALGEPPACPGAPAIRNALLQATGVKIDRIPLTPPVLFEEFSRQGLLKREED